jgi:hypothetical protein
MTGSPLIAGWIAQAAFWCLLVYGWVWRVLDFKPVVLFLLLWVAAWIGLPYIPYGPAASMFSPCVAALDVALVFVIFKGDVRLT